MLMCPIGSNRTQAILPKAASLGSIAPGVPDVPLSAFLSTLNHCSSATFVLLASPVLSSRVPGVWRTGNTELLPTSFIRGFR
jgi:hypothetical protein